LRDSLILVAGPRSRTLRRLMAVAMVVRVMVDREHEAESVADRQTMCQRGSGLPLVSSPKGSSRRPITNAIAVNATGVPTVP
jgi:hypothetical protein